MPNKILGDSEAPTKGQQVITACAFIHHNFNGVEKVFLPKRADTKKFLPGVYELPGGHIDYGEDIIDGLKREMTEELGMNITVGDPFAIFTYVNHIKGSHSIQVSYFAKFSDVIEKIKLDAEVHSTFGWFPENELDKVVSTIKGKDDPEIQVMRRDSVYLTKSLYFWVGWKLFY